jgi:WD40 repeat protein
MRRRFSRLVCVQVKLWDLRKLKNLHTLALPGGAAGLCVKFDHSGSFLASGCGGGQAVVQAVKEWAPVALLGGHGKECTGLAFNLDATVLATCSLDRTVKLWGK